MASNGIIASLLTRFSNNNVKLVFNVNSLTSPPGKLILAQMDSNDPTGQTFFITFNSEVISDEGNWQVAENYTTHKTLHLLRML